MNPGSKDGMGHQALEEIFELRPEVCFHRNGTVWVKGGCPGRERRLEGEFRCLTRRPGGWGRRSTAGGNGAGIFAKTKTLENSSEFLAKAEPQRSPC